MPDKDRSRHNLKTFTKDAGKESLELEALEQEGGKEASKDTRDALEVKSLELSWVGKFWGGGKEKTSNIAGIISLLVLGLSFLILIVIIFLIAFADKGSTLLSNAVTGIISIITLVLGYLFGRREQQGSLAQLVRALS